MQTSDLRLCRGYLIGIGGTKMNDIPLNERYTLTINESSQYFHIGVKRLRRLAEMNVGVFSIRCGNRFLIVRPKFEEYLLQNCLI